MRRTVTTRAHRAVGAAIAGAALLAALAGCGGTATPTPTAAESHSGHSGSHTMEDGRTMSDEEMPDRAGMDMSGHGHGGHGGGGVALWATQKSGGKIMVTDGDGNPLYRSSADGTAPPRSSCVGPCTDQWQPVTIEPGQTPELLGVQQTAVGTLKRADGGTQLTLGGAPLYRHAGEAVKQPDPAQFAAQGWTIVDTSGRPVAG
jgi:predicted lipoprotein with Yx(FWY)xxD motif